MKRLLPVVLLGLLCLCLAAPLTAQDEQPKEKEPKEKEPKAAPGELETTLQKGSYAYGFRIGKDIARRGMIDIESFLAGVRTALESGKPALSEKDMDDAFGKLREEIMARMRKKSEEDAQKNKVAGEEYLKANSTKEGVVVTASGLQYTIMKAGDGPKPKATDRVTVHYHGTLIDGTVFDSSVDRGSPATFPVGGVIKGWVEALQLMPQGSKWKLFIPSDLAYGENPRPGGPIGPNAVLVFEVELLKIEGK